MTQKKPAPKSKVSAPPRAPLKVSTPASATSKSAPISAKWGRTTPSTMATPSKPVLPSQNSISKFSRPVEHAAKHAPTTTPKPLFKAPVDSRQVADTFKQSSARLLSFLSATAKPASMPVVDAVKSASADSAALEAAETRAPGASTPLSAASKPLSATKTLFAASSETTSAPMAVTAAKSAVNVPTPASAALPVASKSVSMALKTGSSFAKSASTAPKSVSPAPKPGTQHAKPIPAYESDSDFEPAPTKKMVSSLFKNVVMPMSDDKTPRALELADRKWREVRRSHSKMQEMIEINSENDEEYVGEEVELFFAKHRPVDSDSEESYTSKKSKRKRQNGSVKKSDHRKKSSSAGSRSYSAAYKHAEAPVLVTDTLPKRRDASNTVVHNTSWRRCFVDQVPVNVLPSRTGEVNIECLMSRIDQPLTEFGKPLRS